MRDFVKWCFSVGAPEWVGLLAAVVAMLVVMIYFVVATIFAVAGLWVVTLIMIVGVPLYLLIHAYKNRKH